MARPLRVEFDRALYHLAGRGNGQAVGLAIDTTDPRCHSFRCFGAGSEANKPEMESTNQPLRRGNAAKQICGAGLAVRLVQKHGDFSV